MLDEAALTDFTTIWEKNKLRFIIGGLGVLLLGIGVLSIIIISSKTSSEIEILPAEKEEEKGEIVVHVNGAVQNPGLYKLKPDARINDALVAAGGLAVEADREWFEKYVNLAQKIPDGVKLYIPFKNEIEKKEKVPNSAKALLDEEGLVAGEQSIFIQETQGKININTASLSELDSLPGIGAVYGQKIIDYRNANGPFSNIEEITKVKGIGQSIFEKIKDKISVY